MSTPTYKNLSSLIEQPESRRRENGDNVTQTRIYIGEYDVAKAAQKIRNTVGTGDLEGYLIRSSVVEPMRGLLGKLIDTWVAGGDDADPETNPLPPDEISVTAVNQSPKVERNPLFAALTEEHLKNVDDAIRAASPEARQAAYDALNPLGQKLVNKIRGGAESYYLATLRYSWVTHFYSTPTMYRGGWLEAPGGPLTSYFVGDLSWLREADDMQYQNGIWRLTRTWLGAANLAWDPELYS